MHDLFQSYGLTHRTRHSIVAKFWHFEQQLNKVERLLREEGLTHFDVNGETQRAVLKMCPYYRQLAPALRPSWLLRPQHYSSSGDMESDAQSKSTEDGEVETWASSSVQRAATTNLKSKNGRAHPQKIEYAYNSAVAIRWDSDAANGRPSSLDVLLEWLVVPGNAERWCVASGKHDGSQSILACEVYDLLLVHGITYRSRRTVVGKLRWWEEQFDKAESLLKKSGIQRFDDSAEAKRMVLRICPAYPKIAHVLRSARQSVATASSRPGRGWRLRGRWTPSHVATRALETLWCDRRIWRRRACWSPTLSWRAPCTPSSSRR